jgi:hypothetical protein
VLRPERSETPLEAADIGATDALFHTRLFAELFDVGVD